MDSSIARKLIPNTGENMQKFIESCSDDDLMVVLRYIQAQLKDELELRIRMQDPTNSIQTMDYEGAVNACRSNQDV